MSRDPVPEILALLGLSDDTAPPYAAPTEEPLISNRVADQATLPGILLPLENGREFGDGLLARSGTFSLWCVSNGVAKWVELRGAEPVFRATRTKAKFLCTVEGLLESWAQGEKPQTSVVGCSIRILGGSTPRLEIRNKDWRPIRLCRSQARALMTFCDTLRCFANSD